MPKLVESKKPKRPAKKPVPVVASATKKKPASAKKKTPVSAQKSAKKKPTSEKAKKSATPAKRSATPAKGSTATPKAAEPAKKKTPTPKMSSAKKRKRAESTPRGSSDQKRRNDCLKLATKARRSIEGLQRGRKLMPLSDHTQTAAQLAVENSISAVTKSLPRKRQHMAHQLLGEIATTIESTLLAAESPATWNVGVAYETISTNNRLLERSLLLNEAHRHELQQGLDGMRRQLKEEQEALANLREETDELRERAVANSEVHALLRGPKREVSVTGALLSQARADARPAPEVTEDPLKELKKDLLQPLATLEARSSTGLPVLELLGNVRDQLCHELLT